MYYENNNDPSNPNDPQYWGYQYVQEPVPPKPKKKGMSSGKIVALALCCSLLGGIIGAAGVAAYQHLSPSESLPAQQTIQFLEGVRRNSVIETVELPTDTLMTPAQVYAANVNSTVGITTSITTNFWGYQTTSAASGSGFILSSDGYILTNFHVIEDSSAITVTCYDGTSYDAELIGYDESNDIAVLKVDAQDLAPVILGSSDNMNVGDSVIAIGNPLGELTFSLTAGTVSALDRQITMSNGATMNLIQTDCAINSGNSGGALFNLYGEVVGITNAKYSSSSASEASIDNIGFAIPINSVRSIVESIIEKGYISKPYIGVSVSDVSAQTQLYGIPAGAAVQSVAQDGPAAAAGLQPGDIITKMNDTAITGSTQLVELIGDASVGDVLVLSVYRQGSTMEISVTVGEQIQQALEQNPQVNEQQYSQYPQNPWGFYGW
ncbi:MAG: trypsin-like peptidase domain-containing protein [Oscillospiraceae bacterium]|nr:trypsin-like peptidase domain-containing protein [Oscillospiraceae bacterium]